MIKDVKTTVFFTSIGKLPSKITTKPVPIPLNLGQALDYWCNFQNFHKPLKKKRNENIGKIIGMRVSLLTPNTLKYIN